MRNCSAKIIPALWLSLFVCAAAAPTQDESAALFGRAVTSFERKDFLAAERMLKQAQPTVPILADYVGYYLAAVHAELNPADGVTADLAPIHGGDMRSPMVGRAWLVEARALESANPAGAAQLLSDHYPELPQPDGDLLMASSYQLAGEARRAAESYQRVYYTSRASDAVGKAGAALALMKKSMGSAYPAPAARLLLIHADRLLAAKDYLRARLEYKGIVELGGLEGEQAAVRLGQLDLLSGKAELARTWLAGLKISHPEADAERLYGMVECARKLKDDADVASGLGSLGDMYPKSPWRLKALVATANAYLVANRPSDYLPLYQAAYRDFPSEPATGLWHWKVVFQAYLHDAPDSAAMLRDHLEQYGTHSTSDSALYFLGRRSERDGQPGAARTFYQKLAQTFPNHYYAMLARDRLRAPEIAAVAVTPLEARDFVESLRLTEPKPFGMDATYATARRSERARLLRVAGLNALADAELRFGARTDCQPGILAMELASTAEAPHQAMRIMKVALAGLSEPHVRAGSAALLGSALSSAVPQRTRTESSAGGDRPVSTGRPDPPGIGVRP